jgi:membrane associated rhomboid family serine protease
MRDGYTDPPFNQVSPVVWALLLPIVAMEVVLSASGAGLVGGTGGIGWRTDALLRFALDPRMLAAMVSQGQWPTDLLMRFVTYPFVHASLLQAVMAAVFVLALGKFVAEVFRPWTVPVLFMLASVAGGLTYSLVPGQTVLLYGGFPGAYGLIGAFTFIVWARLGLLHATRERAFLFVGFLLGFQVVMWLIFGGPLTFVADLGGFLAGFALSFALVPGGPAKALARLRRR